MTITDMEKYLEMREEICEGELAQAITDAVSAHAAKYGAIPCMGVIVAVLLDCLDLIADDDEGDAQVMGASLAAARAILNHPFSKMEGAGETLQ